MEMRELMTDNISLLQLLETFAWAQTTTRHPQTPPTGGSFLVLMDVFIPGICSRRVMRPSNPADAGLLVSSFVRPRCTEACTVSGLITTGFSGSRPQATIRCHETPCILGFSQPCSARHHARARALPALCMCREADHKVHMCPKLLTCSHQVWPHRQPASHDMTMAADKTVTQDHPCRGSSCPETGRVHLSHM